MSLQQFHVCWGTLGLHDVFYHTKEGTTILLIPRGMDLTTMRRGDGRILSFRTMLLRCSADPGQRLLAVEEMLGELMEKRARLQRLLGTEDTREMLAFFRDNGVMHESGRAVQKLLEQEELLKGNTLLSRAGACIMGPMHCG